MRLSLPALRAAAKDRPEMSHFGGPLASLRHVARGGDAHALPRWRQLAEIVLLYGLRGIGPGYYV